MLILALETSHLPGYIALLDGSRLIQQQQFDGSVSTTSQFSSSIARVLSAANYRPQDVECVAVSRGPGSFTGLRIGITMSKIWALATGARVCACSTLEVIAHQGPHSEEVPLVVAVDAQRGEVLTATFQWRIGRLQRIKEPQLLDGLQWLQTYQPGQLLMGPALKSLQSDLPDDVRLAPEEQWFPQATTLGRLAHEEILAGIKINPWGLVPEYSRPSAAEERISN